MKYKSVATHLIKKHRTNNPFEIANAENIVICKSDLGSVRGFYLEAYKVKIIHLNEALEYNESLIVCAHELGHAKLHIAHNSAFMSTNTLYPMNKYEIEADKFMIHLLYPDDAFMEFVNYTVPQVAQITNLPAELVEYRFYTFQQQNFNLLV